VEERKQKPSEKLPEKAQFLEQAAAATCIIFARGMHAVW
jgi:hypothetical protein